MPLFEIRADRFTPVVATTLRGEGLREREDLQRLLRDHVEVVAPGTFLLCEEFGEWEDSRRRIDLLALDIFNSLVTTAKLHVVAPHRTGVTLRIPRKSLSPVAGQAP